MRICRYNQCEKLCLPSPSAELKRPTAERGVFEARMYGSKHSADHTTIQATGGEVQSAWRWVQRRLHPLTDYTNQASNKGLSTKTCTKFFRSHSKSSSQRPFVDDVQSLEQRTIRSLYKNTLYEYMEVALCPNCTSVGPAWKIFF